jgi:hypothetical protein
VTLIQAAPGLTIPELEHCPAISDLPTRSKSLTQSFHVLLTNSTVHPSIRKANIESSASN